MSAPWTVSAAGDERQAFRDAASGCDGTLVIAPEFDHILADRCEWVRESACDLFVSAADAIALHVGTSSPLARATGALTAFPRRPRTDREPTACEAFPVVWKPRDGAGSTATYRLDTAFAVASAVARRATEFPGPMVLQEFVPGWAAGVAFLCGPGGYFPLAPAFQILSADGRFKYLGGELPVPPELADRAARLATRAVGCVPGLRGYVGVDLVLGDAADGSGDVAIEINPRLTTSYVGLRARAGFNVAEAMVRGRGGGNAGHVDLEAGPRPLRPGRGDHPRRAG